MSMKKVALVSGISAVFVLLSLVYLVGFRVVDAFYIAFTTATAVASILSLSEREVNVGTVAGFVSLLLAIGILGHLGFLNSAIVINTPSGAITIPSDMIPWFALGVVAIFIVMFALGANVSALGLWTLVVLLMLAYFAVSDNIIRMLIVTVIALINAIPLYKQESKGMLFALAPAPTVLTINLAELNPYLLILVTLLSFVALDPFNIVKKTVRMFASVLNIFISLIMVISLFIAL